MSTERQIVEKFKEALETKNIDVIVPHMAEDMAYELLPSTVGRKVNKAQWAGMISAMCAMTHSIKLDFVNVIENPLFVVVQTDATFTFQSGPAPEEILILFHFTKDANGALKISRLVEYVDSVKMKAFEAMMAGGAPPS